ncbi:MAG: flagellar protein FliS [Lachnospiraceae bacterium]|nr:flagellar protein FliS [Lachnospiraceae bacterium]
MTNEKKQIYKNRIMQANRSELIVIMYDMIYDDMEEAIHLMEEERWEEVKKTLDHIEMVIRRLENDLDHTYKISDELFVLYHFCLKELAKCRIKKNLEGMHNAKKVLDPLYVAMQGMAKEDKSAPMMKRTQNIAYGITYGKSSLNRVCIQDPNRGYLA